MSIRRSASAASLLGTTLLLLTLAGGALATSPGAPPEVVVLEPTAPAGRLLVGEVMTGGTSASDEFVELYNAGSAEVDLAGLEVVYVTSSGGTVTRKVTWSVPLLVGPGRHVLVANSAGGFATLADAVYTGGLSSGGGVIVVRPVGGAPLDALAWGDAMNPFVEGRAAPAPAAGWSIERWPGGSAGNWADSDDNSADTFLQSAPVAQRLADPPAPDPTATPTAEPTATATAEPTPSAPPTPTPTPTPSPTASPSPTPTPTPSPTPTASTPIALARLMPLGSTVTIEGRLTTDAAFTELGRGAFVQDATGGIALYLSAEWPALSLGDGVRVTGRLETRYEQLTLRLVDPAAITTAPTVVTVVPVETTIAAAGESLEGRVVHLTGEVTGVPTGLADGYSVELSDGDASLRVVVADRAGIDAAAFPRNARIGVTGVLGQHASGSSSGYRVHLRAPSDVTLIAPPPTPTPTPAPTPTPTPAPTPTPTPRPNPTPTPSRTAGPTPTPSHATPSPTRATASPSPSRTPDPTPSVTPTPPLSIAAARARQVGEQVTVSGVTSVEVGRLLGDATIVIQDASGGLAVRLPDGAVRPARGAVVLVTGELADPYGNLELRPQDADGVSSVGRGALPEPVQIPSRSLAEGNEGRLAQIVGTLTAVEGSSSGTLTLTLEDASGEARVYGFEPVGLDRDAYQRGQGLRVVGVVGQRASARGRPDGYRLWPRDVADVTVLSTPAPSVSASPPSTPPPSSRPTPRPSATLTPRPSRTPVPSASSSTRPATAPAVSIAGARTRQGQRVTVAGVVTAPATLLDADGRRVTLEDGSGAVLVRLMAQDAAPSVGTRMRVSGEVGTYYGGTQLGALATAVRMGSGPATPAAHTAGALDAADEWRLLRVSGTVDAVHRDGDGWRAEIRLAGGTFIAIVGLPRAGIAATALVAGRSATVIGIARPPYPTASDRRLVLVPRNAHDITLGAAGADASLTGTAPTRPSTAAGTSLPSRATGGAQVPTAQATPDADVDPRAYDGPGAPTAPASGGASDAVRLADLDALLGRTVRVGGRVVDLTGTTAVLADDSGRAALLWQGDPSLVAASLPVGATVNVVGTVVRDAAGDPAIAVAGPEGVSIAAVLGDPGGEIPEPSPGTQESAASASSGSSSPATAAAAASLGDPLGRATSATVGDPPASAATALWALLLLAGLVAAGVGLAVRPEPRARLGAVRRRVLGSRGERLVRLRARHPPSTESAAVQARDPVAHA